MTEAKNRETHDLVLAVMLDDSHDYRGHGAAFANSSKPDKSAASSE
jgi:hypothetical protein